MKHLIFTSLIILLFGCIDGKWVKVMDGSKNSSITMELNTKGTHATFNGLSPDSAKLGTITSEGHFVGHYRSCDSLIRKTRDSIYLRMNGKIFGLRSHEDSTEIKRKWEDSLSKYWMLEVTKEIEYMDWVKKFYNDPTAVTEENVAKEKWYNKICKRYYNKWKKYMDSLGRKPQLIDSLNATH